MSFLWEKIARPLLFRVDTEKAHEWGMQVLRSGIVGRLPGIGLAKVPSGLAIECFGLRFSNPLGLAAGFDKNGAAIDQLADLGFGFVEVGTVTYEPQPGNPKPRLFRLPDDMALINRLGFNNEGAEAVASRLMVAERRCVIGVNIGRNKTVSNEDAKANYIKCLEVTYPAADYIAINISSPNTPELRDLQKGENLHRLLRAVIGRAEELGIPENKGSETVGLRKDRKPILVKIAPDLTDDEIISVADSCMEHGIDGIIATNTTVSRDGLQTKNIDRIGPGGLSGRPLAKRSNEVISLIYRHTGGNLPIIGVGGIFTAQDAFEKIAAGACLIQAYTGFVYGGPRFAADLLTGLRRIMDEREFSTVDEAVGAGVKRQ